jgi:hypothetical protein
MQGAIFANAANGDIPSIDACLRIIHQRARLLGLYPSDKHHSPLHVSVGGPDAPNAEDTGIQVTFVQARPRTDDGKVIEVKPIVRLNGSKP